MTPATLQSIFSSILVVGMILTCFGTIGYRHYSKKVNQKKEQITSAQIENLTEQNNELITGKNELIVQNNKLLREIEKNRQVITSKLNELLESTYKDNKTNLSARYPAGDILFGVDRSFPKAIPRAGDLLAEYEFDWSKVKIEELTANSLTILLPDICYKPLNTRLIGVSMTINRKPLGKAYILPVKPEGALHRIFIELLKDNDQQLIFMIGLKKTDA